MSTTFTFAASRSAALTRVTLLCLVTSVALFACSDQDGIMEPSIETEPSDPPPGVFLAALTCTVDGQAETMTCEGAGGAGLSEQAGALSPISGPLIVGGQNQYVTLTSSNVNTGFFPSSGTFATVATVTVENLIVQALGTEDGSTLHADGIRVFYHTLPVVDGEGEVDILLNDGVASYTGVDQPYYQYDEVLEPNSVSAGIVWRWEYPTSVNSFTFQVYVRAVVQHPNGWIDLTPEELTVPVGNSTAIAADVYSAVELLPSATVDWASSHPSIATVDGSGNVTGVADGYALITATSGDLTAEAVATVGTPPPVDITSISPSPMVTGQTATITGSGFNPVDPEGNIVQVDGVPATVTSVTSSELQFVVPACRPAKDATVTVEVGVESDQLTHPQEPSAYVSLAVGEQMLIQDPSQACFQFDASTSSEAYLMGVQHVSEVAAESAMVQVTSVTAPVTAPMAAARLVEPALEGGGGGDQEGVIRLRDRAGEVAARKRIHEAMGPGPHRLAAPDEPLAAVIPGNVTVGSSVALSYFDTLSSTPCDDPPLTVSGTVKANGTHSIWVNDDENDATFTDAQFQSLSDELDSYIYQSDVDYFGAPTDIDGNGKIIILVTEKLTFTLGFVSPNDLQDVSECTASNEAEIFYGGAPGTPIRGVTRTAEQLVNEYPKVITHELAHIIQYGRRMQLVAPFMEVWQMEGQAQLAVEVAGHTQTPLASGGNHGWSEMWADGYWYYNPFSTLRFYFGADGSGSGRVAGAPEECSWIYWFTGVPCFRATSFHYDVSWSFLRWVSDQFGPGHSGGEQGLNRDLIGGSTRGFEDYERVTGVPIETLLAQWGAALYTDDRPEIVGLDPALTFTSWDLYDIYYNSTVFDADDQLTPRERGFVDFTDNLKVRASSAGYFRISGSSRDPTAIRIRDGSDQLLPAAMQVWLVRLE